MISATADPAGRFERVRDVIRHGLVEHAIPSIAVAAAQGGEVVWEEGFGWADREARIAATPHTMYALASISKSITATAIMILKERGIIDLDRPINEYLGEAPTGHARYAGYALVSRVSRPGSAAPRECAQRRDRGVR